MHQQCTSEEEHLFRPSGSSEGFVAQSLTSFASLARSEDFPSSDAFSTAAMRHEFSHFHAADQVLTLDKAQCSTNTVNNNEEKLTLPSFETLIRSINAKHLEQ